MMQSRRQLDFHSAREVIDEVNRLRATPYDKLGNWNLAQICQHLSRTIDIGLHPDGKRLPWIFRKTLGEPMVRSWLKRRRIKPNSMTTKQLVPEPTLSADDATTIDAYIDRVHRVEAFQGSLETYPLCDITPQDWQQLQYIHAAHHLGYLLPRG